MLFEQVLPALREGRLLRRSVWPDTLFVFKQKENFVDNSKFQQMSSLPDDAKKTLASSTLLFLDYNFQVLHVDMETGVAKNFIPDWEDLFAEDWVIY